MTIPTSLNIGGHTYTLKGEAPEFFTGTDGDLIQLGQHEGHNLLIQYDNSIPESVQEEVIVHEIVHALIQNSGLCEVLENEEQVCCILQNILWQFLINNTEVFNEG